MAYMERPLLPSFPELPVPSGTPRTQVSSGANQPWGREVGPCRRRNLPPPGPVPCLGLAVPTGLNFRPLGPSWPLDSAFAQLLFSVCGWFLPPMQLWSGPHPGRNADY